MRTPLRRDGDLGVIELPETERRQRQDNSPGNDEREKDPPEMLCPRCGKKLRIHDPITKEPRPLPPPGKGFGSRAKCSRCQTIIYYLGNYKWAVLNEGDLTPEDRSMDKLFWDPKVGKSGDAAFVEAARKKFGDKVGDFLPPELLKAYPEERQ